MKTGEAAGNLCLGTKTLVQERVRNLPGWQARRKNEVKRRCWTVLQSGAEALLCDSQPDPQHPTNAHPTLALFRECRQLHISVIPAEAGIQNPHQQCGIRSQIYPDPDSLRNDGRFDDTA